MMKKLAAGLPILLTAFVIVVGVVAYSYLKPTEAASEPIQAIPIAQTTASASPSAVATAASVATSGATATATATSTGAATTTTSATASAPAATTAASSAAPAATATTAAIATTTAATTNTVYEIDQASSKARFVIGEVLNGSPFTVNGTTDQVAGQIAFDLGNPSAAQLGTIQINARTLATDSTQRDNAIKNRILKTDANEYITFVPTALVGLPTNVTTGQSYTFQIVGQLTLVGQTHEATFAVTVTPTAAGTLEGSATTIIAYADWGISIPQVPSVASVDDTVTLALTFVATAK